MAHTYESLTVGDSYSFSRTITAKEVELFAEVTGDDNPLHVDPEYAETTSFGRPIVHGVFLLGLVSKLLGRDFPGHGSIAVSLSARFLRPVPVGEEVTIEVKVAEKIENRKHIRFRTKGSVQGKMAFSGEAVLIPPTES